MFSPVHICLHDLFVSAPTDTRVVDKCIQKLSLQVCFNLDHSFLNRFLITHIELDHLYQVFAVRVLSNNLVDSSLSFLQAARSHVAEAVILRYKLLAKCSTDPSVATGD
jgi:hypothetical protein